MNKDIQNFQISAPRFNLLLQRAKAQPIVIKPDEIALLMSILEKMKSSITVSGTDDYRHFWFYLDRGKIRDYGSFAEYRREGSVDTREEFKELWLGDYPEEKHWYHFETNEYNGEYYFYVDSELTFHISKDKPESYEKVNNSKLLSLLSNIVDTYCQWIVEDNTGYNQFINLNLSYQRRLGKIIRWKYWEINPDDKKMITKGISEKDITLLEKIVEQSSDDYPLPAMETMTSGKFFEYCRMGYDANGYFKRNPDISNLDAYSAFADGRDEGLREIDPDSEKEFRKWFFDRNRFGGHPWEVCRGGNSTHISLYIHHEEAGWSLQLGGSSCTRVSETVKFALALYKNHIPFKLFDAAEILDMVTGKDYIGIVPQEVFPQYCHSLFEDENENERIIDFMNLGWEDTDKIIAAAEWYPVKINRQIT